MFPVNQQYNNSRYSQALIVILVPVAGLPLMFPVVPMSISFDILRGGSVVPGDPKYRCSTGSCGSVVPMAPNVQRPMDLMVLL